MKRINLSRFRPGRVDRQVLLGLGRVRVSGQLRVDHHADGEKVFSQSFGKTFQTKHFHRS